MLRMVAGVAAIIDGIITLQAGLPAGTMPLQAFGIGAGLLLVVGLWTPFAGSLLAVLELWEWLSVRPADPLANILMVGIGAALALVGPGAWSVDARLFGWKRIDLGK